MLFQARRETGQSLARINQELMEKTEESQSARYGQLENLIFFLKTVVEKSWTIIKKVFKFRFVKSYIVSLSAGEPPRLRRERPTATNSGPSSWPSG